MLKDLADSKRLNASIKALAPEPGAALRREADLSTHSATIVSALFWPPVTAEQLVLPGKVSSVARLLMLCLSDMAAGCRAFGAACRSGCAGKGWPLPGK